MVVILLLGVSDCLNDRYRSRAANAACSSGLSIVMVWPQHFGQPPRLCIRSAESSFNVDPHDRHQT